MSASPQQPPQPPIRHRRLWNALTLLALLAVIAAAAWHALHTPSLPEEAAESALPDPFAVEPTGDAPNLLAETGPEPAPKAAAIDTVAPADSTLAADSILAADSPKGLPIDTAHRAKVAAPEVADTL